MAQFERGEGNRKERLSKIKRGPGVFVYQGGAYDTEWIPQVKYTRGTLPVIGEDGRVATDHNGNIVVQQAGVPVRDDKGQPVLGGEPKVIRKEVDPYKIRGLEFPKGEPIFVDSPEAAFKLRCLSFFEEADGDAPSATEEAKPKRKRKAVVESAEQ